MTPDSFTAAELRLSEENAALRAALERAEAEAKVVCDSYADENQRLSDALERAEAERDEAREALRPFVEQARLHAADAPEWRDSDTVNAVVSIGDLRRALQGGDKP